MGSRTEDIQAFLTKAGWADAKRAPLAGDASFRRYERIRNAGRCAVLMDAPPQHEDVRPFMKVGESLLATGMSAPRVLAADTEKGFLLLEDLGDDLFSTVLKHSPDKEEELYLAASDVLAALYHTAPRADYSGFNPYDETVLMRECMLFAQWFLPAVTEQRTAKRLGEEFMLLWQTALASLPEHDPVLVLRDFHADNLLWLPQREHLQKVGLLDFQDAVIGPPAYDMVSFLEDARRDVKPETVKRTVQHYLAKTGQRADAFMASYAVLGAQRNCKIIGIFCRLALRDKKPNYLAFLPRVWKHLAYDLKHPLLAPLGRWMDENIAEHLRGVLQSDAMLKQVNA